ncbi:hypothetical protein SAMN05444159_1268 [Bradyrhizobium lablabi]|uniref:Uncharacterized protein n=1 Tax=Bradyrhizobium lablabi TaxID=722472 RepID=A0A1M6LGC7_9BRAD|nr:hypothetical protein [Bradyrhizobium lablabi]SHJ70226.1 hypothetical protein SAMN05444159_1268 [Bradyrhizobium lablabi]
MSYLIAALDDALAQAGEDIILRRVIGTAPNQVNIDVKCRARVNAATVQQLVAAIPATEMNVILSPTQINNAQWPGGHIPLQPPFDVDQRIPRVGGADKMIVRNVLRSITFVDAKVINGELVRLDVRVSG